MKVRCSRDRAELSDERNLRYLSAVDRSYVSAVLSTLSRVLAENPGEPRHFIPNGGGAACTVGCGEGILGMVWSTKRRLKSGFGSWGFCGSWGMRGGGAHETPQVVG